ncbi:MAG: hypothetical protein ACO3JL_13705 [Myxococcota bacterium]
MALYTSLALPQTAAALPEAPARPLEQRAAALARGYYLALIEGRYEEAAGFLHPAVIEPLRDDLLGEAEGGPPQRGLAIAKALGVSDLLAVRSLSAERFFAAWAKSPYGTSVQVLSRPELKSVVDVTDTRCSEAQGLCRVQLILRATGEPTLPPSSLQVWAVNDDHRWLLTLTPPRSRAPAKP